MLKTALLLLMSACLALSAFVYEAARATENALLLVAASKGAQSPLVRRQILDGAADSITTNWAHADQWHAGAAEALSAVQAARGDAADGDQALYRESIAAANRAVALAPVQPGAWLRLAQFAQQRVAGTVCEASVCLERSWRSAAMIAPEIGCFRLRLANSMGLLSGPDDERILWYVQSGPGRAAAARCL